MIRHVEVLRENINKKILSQNKVTNSNTNCIAIKLYKRLIFEWIFNEFNVYILTYVFNLVVKRHSTKVVTVIN